MDMSVEILTTALSDHQDSQRSARPSLDSRSSLDSTSFPLSRTSMSGAYDQQPAYTRRFLSIDGRRGNALDIPTARSLGSTSTTLSSVSSTPHGSWALDASTEMDSRVSGYSLYGSSAPLGSSSMHAASNLLSASSLPQPIPAGKRLQVIGRKAAAALGDIEAYWKSMYLE